MDVVTAYQVLRKPRPLWRRVRKSPGETWVPDTSLHDFSDKGIVCKDCHKRRLYKDLDITFEMQGSDVIRLWICSYCGLVVRTENMTDLSIKYELEGRFS